MFNSLSSLPEKALKAFQSRNPHVFNSQNRDSVKSSLCLYEGPVVEPCSCPDGSKDVRICAHPNPADLDRDKFTRVYVSDKITTCQDCQDRKTSYDLDSLVAMFNERSLSPKVRGKRFNSGLLPYKDGYLLTYRTGWAGSDIHIAILNERFFPTGEDFKLELYHHMAAFGREDPRLFRFRGDLYVAYTGVTGNLIVNQLYAKIREDFTVEEIFYPQYASMKPGKEKNWQFFEHEDRLLAIYKCYPAHRVLLIEGNNAWLANDPPSFKNWEGGEPRGGCPPVRVGDEYWHFFHDRIPVRGINTYRTHLYTFQANPPFQPKRIARRPLMTADGRTKPASQYASVVFSCGAVRKDHLWYISSGIHDRWTEIHKFSHVELESLLDDIRA